jgi:hypothetical protein
MEESSLMNTFDRVAAPVHNYVDLPPEAPQPRIWKSLGHVMPGFEMHYGLETFDGDKDVDRESELRWEVLNLGQALARDGVDIVGMVLAQQFGSRCIVRFVQCSCGSNLYTTRN